MNLLHDVRSIGDFDRDGFIDIIMTMPTNATNGPDSGVVFLFWGSKDGFPALEPYNADLVITGEEGFLLGQSVVAWDYAGDTWPDLVIGCPGALGGTGKLLVYESSDINIAVKGTILDPSQAVFEIAGNDTYLFGSHLEVGDMTGDGVDDLMVLSMRSGTTLPRFEMFSGGVLPDFGYEIELPQNSVKNNTRTASLDLYGTGRDAFIFSSPDNGELRIINIEVSDTPFFLPGANVTGVVDLQGSIATSGNTWGWGAGDDGWDTSPTHIYDSATGYDSVRYNEATGNANNANRSIGVENKLFIEVGGILTTSNERDMSGAYGVSFRLLPSNINGINSAILSFDWEYEDWGFESQERLWIKARLTGSSGSMTYLGSGMDRNPEPDLTPEIFTMPGQTTSNGPNLFGTGSFQTDILQLIDGPGEYYLDMGGKISRWTASSEFGGFGFDNITLTFRTLSHDIKTLTGSGGLGSGLLSADCDRDGQEDLMVGSPTQGTVRIFRGGQPYWVQLAGINQGMCNTTITGTPNSGIGTSMARLGTSPFNLVPSIAIAAPLDYIGPGSLGRIYVFDLPIPDGELAVASAREVNDAPEDFNNYGWRVISVEDHDGNLYPELLVLSWTWSGHLRTTLVDRSPTPPKLWILTPKRHETVSGHVNISARVFDIDKDAKVEDVRFYRSSDNRSWNPIGDGSPDSVEGDVAVKFWNTTLFANGGYFFKVSIIDSFGLETAMYTDRVDVLNHAPPFVKLIYPADLTELRWVEDITAKVIIPSSEELDPPVRFYYSRDNITWTEYANRSAPIDGATSDYMAEFDTEPLMDGPIWFMVNASTRYGLGSGSRNIAPAFINNYYPPQGEILRPFPGSTISGAFIVTVSTQDQDDDVISPLQLFVRQTDVETWDLLGNMTGGQNGTFTFEWDTTLLDNGEYDLMARVVDSTNLQVELMLDEPVTIHNLYEPAVTITSHTGGDSLTGLVTFTAVVTDRDMNIRESDIRFLYRPQGVDIWNSMGRTFLLGTLVQVNWDSTTVKNGLIDVRVEVTDQDNLTGMHQISDVRVKNIYGPKLQTNLPSFNLPLSGVVRLSFNVSDDEPVPPANIKVEVLVRTTWVVIDNVSRTDPGGAFVPDQWTLYYVDWNTAERDGSGDRMFPDSLGYDVKVTVTDSDGEMIEYITPVAYHVRNEGIEGDDDDDGQALFLEGWMIAVIVIVIILLFILILLIFMFRGDRKIKEPVPKVSVPQVTAIPASHPTSLEPLTPVEKREGGIYSPPGWEPSTVTAPAEDIPLFMAGSETVDLGIDLDLEQDKDEEDLTDLRDELFGQRKERKPKRPAIKRTRQVRAPVIEETVDIMLPEGVVPPSIAQRGTEAGPEEEWGETEEWGEDEDWEELDEEELEELDEEEWEDVDEEPKEDLIITCKCGEKIEIPSVFKGTKFRCPQCGRKGSIPGR
ncbi:MAG: hypothetical protein JXA22_07170 [Candidatus Thermoplasmatota archaeon]|nr:hypothetical protein [Candidatus Thermoplasmatota archaeon]